MFRKTGPLKFFLDAFVLPSRGEGFVSSSEALALVSYMRFAGSVVRIVKLWQWRYLLSVRAGLAIWVGH